MKKFKYEAIDKEGKRLEKVAAAKTLEHVIFKILQDGLYPTRVEELSGTTLFTHNKLKKLKELKQKLEPQDMVEEPTKTAQRNKTLFPKIILVFVFISWLAAIILYSLL